ncbi:MAG TPA: hypothetical protein VNM91_07795 [Dehalococcoidia bacterium]|nr:hypothetical protein [Dehalococcoidia bacterium]
MVAEARYTQEETATGSGGVEDELTRTEKLRIAARVLIRRGMAGNGRRWGLQSRLAEHFGVTRQRVSQIVRQELNALNADSR